MSSPVRPPTANLVLLLPPFVRPFLDAVKHLPSPRREPLLSLLTEFQDIISRDIYDLGACSLVTHEIHLTDPNPVFRKQFPIPTAHISIVHDHVDQWLKNGIIEPASSPYNSPIFCVGKKGGGVRLCLDYRALNAVSLPTQYCIRTVEECIAEIGLAGSTHFCALDLSSGFYHMPLAKASRPLSAFTVQGRGQFQWRVGAMGLSGCPGSFARLMDLAMRDLPNCITYLDDILVHGPDDRSTLAALRRVLARLRHHNLRLNVSKSLFLRPSTPYLGHTLTPHGILPGPDKSEVLRRCVPPQTTKELQSFLGLANYFRSYVPNFARRAAPLYDLTRDRSSWKAGPLPPSGLAAFKDIRDAVVHATARSYPSRSGSFHLFVDASLGAPPHPFGGLGACLMQQEGRKPMRVISFASRQLHPHERNYSAFLLELQACVYGIDFFSHHLRGRHFFLHTDHKPVVKLSKVHTKTLNRLHTLLLEHHCTVVHVDGSQNSVADFLSRCAPPGSAPPSAPPPPTAALVSSSEASALPVDVRNPAHPRHAVPPPSTPARPPSPPPPSLPPPSPPPPPSSSSPPPPPNSSSPPPPSPPSDDGDLPPFPKALPLDASVILSRQLADPALKEIISALSEGRPPLLSPPLSLHSHSLRLLNGLACISLAPRRGFLNDHVARILLPLSLRRRVMRQAHAHKLSGHLGAFKTVERIRQFFWWPKIDSDVQAFIDACPSCQQSRRRSLASPPSPTLLSPPPSPNSRIHIDLYGPLSRPSSAAYILGITDAFTKFVRFAVLPNKTAAVVARALWVHWLAVFGVPITIVSDQGTEFLNDLQAALWEILDVEHKTTTPFWPRCNQQQEHQHKTLAHVLRASILDSGGRAIDWEVFLPSLALALNSAVNPATRQSPHFLLFGYDPRLPLWSDLSVLLDREFHAPGLKPGDSAYFFKWADHVQRARSVAHQALQQFQHRQLHSPALSSSPPAPAFGPGDYVWAHVLPPPAPNPKLQPRWLPAVVVSRTSSSTYKVSLSPATAKRRKIVHLNVSHLRPRSVDAQSTQSDPLFVSSVANQVSALLRHGQPHSVEQYMSCVQHFDLPTLTALANHLRRHPSHTLSLQSNSFPAAQPVPAPPPPPPPPPAFPAAPFPPAAPPLPPAAPRPRLPSPRVPPPRPPRLPQPSPRVPAPRSPRLPPPRPTPASSPRAAPAPLLPRPALPPRPSLPPSPSSFLSLNSSADFSSLSSFLSAGSHISQPSPSPSSLVRTPAAVSSPSTPRADAGSRLSGQSGVPPTPPPSSPLRPPLTSTPRASFQPSPRASSSSFPPPPRSSSPLRTGVGVPVPQPPPNYFVLPTDDRRDIRLRLRAQFLRDVNAHLPREIVRLGLAAQTQFLVQEGYRFDGNFPPP
jgi:hypothetical protein